MDQNYIYSHKNDLSNKRWGNLFTKNQETSERMLTSIRGRPIYRPADILDRYMDFFQYRHRPLFINKKTIFDQAPMAAAGPNRLQILYKALSSRKYSF